MLLRRFTQDLKDQNWFAVGLDVIVVIVGIFLGMQVSEWNDERIKSHVELKLLNSIANDIAQDIINLESMISNEEEMAKFNEELLVILKSDQEYNSSMDRHFGIINRYDIFYPQKFGYESLKNIGLEIIQSDELKEDIVNLYDYHYGVIAETLDVKKQLYLDTNSIFISKLETVKTKDDKISVSLKRPTNFVDLKKNTEFFNHLSHIHAERLNMLNFSKRVMENVSNVYSKLREEIESKES